LREIWGRRGEGLSDLIIEKKGEGGEKRINVTHMVLES